MITKVATAVTEAPPSLRWHVGRVLTSVVRRRAFGEIGTGSVIVSPRVLRGVNRVFLGDGVAIYPGAWLQTEGPDARLTIGDGTYVGHDVHLHSIDPVRIGSRCVIADGVFIASTDHGRGDRAEVRGTGSIWVGDSVFIGQRAIVLGGVTIGDGATVGAGSVVTKDIPAGAVAAGAPARILKEKA